MKINTKEMRSVANFFTKMNKKGGSIDMEITDTNTDRTSNCKTPACVGGWLSVYYKTEIDELGNRNYFDGAETFAEKLGFKNLKGLITWASEYNQLWGNCTGYEMFGEAYAWEEKGERGYKRYEFEDYDKLLLREIAYKLHKVADRIDKAYD